MNVSNVSDPSNFSTWNSCLETETTNDINCVSFDKTSATLTRYVGFTVYRLGINQVIQTSQAVRGEKQDLLVIGPHRGMQLRDWRRVREEQSSPRLLSNVSTGLDAEKLSFEESDVSFSQLTSQPPRARSSFVFRGFAMCSLPIGSLILSMRRFQLASVILSPPQHTFHE